MGSDPGHGLGSKGPRLLSHLTVLFITFLKLKKHVFTEGIPRGPCKPEMKEKNIPTGKAPTP